MTAGQTLCAPMVAYGQHRHPLNHWSSSPKKEGSTGRCFETDTQTLNAQTHAQCVYVTFRHFKLENLVQEKSVKNAHTVGFIKFKFVHFMSSKILIILIIWPCYLVFFRASLLSRELLIFLLFRRMVLFFCILVINTKKPIKIRYFFSFHLEFSLRNAK